jgi:hypothetical protein
VLVHLLERLLPGRDDVRPAAAAVSQGLIEARLARFGPDAVPLNIPVGPGGVVSHGVESEGVEPALLKAARAAAKEAVEAAHAAVDAEAQAALEAARGGAAAGAPAADGGAAGDGEQLPAEAAVAVATCSGLPPADARPHPAPLEREAEMVAA